MPRFAYRAVQPSGRVTKGVISAANENELAHSLMEAGLELIDARRKREAADRPRRGAGGTVPLRVLAGFYNRLHDLLTAGIPFVDAIRDAIPVTEHKVLRAALAEVARSLSSGAGIAASFARLPKIFPPVTTAMLGAGEASGDMVAVADFLAKHTRQRAETAERLRRALRYPLFLLTVAGSAAGFMLSVVVPQIVGFIGGIGGAVPFSTRALVALSNLVSAHGPALLGVLFLSVAAIVALRVLSTGFVLLTDALLLRLPVIGSIILKSTLARFAQAFAMLFRSGCEVPVCLAQARRGIGNRALDARLADASARVVAGSSLSSAFIGTMPDFAIGLLRTGERSGRLAKSLDDIATAYDREAQAAADHAIAMLEPGLTLAIGALLAWTVVAVLGPLYGSLSVLGGRM